MKNHLLMLARVWAAALLFTPVAHAQSPTSTLERVSSFEYDADGLLIKEVVEPDRPDDCLQTSYVYDAYGNRISASSAACTGATGHTISSAASARTITSAYAAQTVTIGGTSYNSPAGTFATSTSNALGQTEAKEYDPRHGGVTKLTGPNGGITTWTYDAFGRKTRENRADGTYTVWAHKLCQVTGQPRDTLCPTVVGSHALDWYISEASYDSTGALLAPIKYQFHDTLDRAVRVQTQDFHGQVVVQDTHYNALGQVNQKSILYRLSGGSPHWTTFTYDAIGRVLSETSPDGNGGTAVTQLAYNGLITTATNPQGQTKTTHKNASGQTSKVVDHLGGEVLYSYDALGQLLQTNAAGTITKISYNRRGQKQSMQDPAMGAWDYAYNAFGELVWQQDSLSQTSTMVYDTLGRMTQRTEPDLVSHWHYDKKADNTACGAGIGKLCEATANNGYRRVHAYDAIGRPTRTDTVLDSAMNPAVVSQAFHPQTGRLASKTWPTGYRATYTYSASGFLSKVEGGGVAGHTQVVSLEVLAMDPQGRITQYKQGNNVTTVNAFDQPTGKLNGVQATLQGQSAGNVLNHSYGYDKLGNLLTRNDINTGVAESFQYDALNRLSMYTALGGGLSSSQAVQTLYDAAGNLKYKSDVGYYHYDPLRPSRLNQVTLAPESGWSAIGAVTQANTGTRALSYAFDDTRVGARSITTANGSQAMGNGNLWYTVSQDQVNGHHTVRWETYTSFNMPQEILLGNLNVSDPAATVADRTLSFAYGPEHQRIRQTVALTSNVPSHMEAGTTWYLNGSDSQGLSYEKEIKANGTIEHKHYVNAGGMSFALYVKREGNLNGKPATSISYFHHDHLGSLAVISNELGAVTERLAYDPWGRRRNVDGQTDVHDALYGVNTDRGYTMHEHLDEMGIIHMNGRLYDPLIGRFMSADPFIQSADNLQSFNRYAYVLNNPLAYTDPSGYFSLKKLFKTSHKFAIAPTAKNAFNFIASQPGQAQIDRFIMNNQWAYAIGQAAATIFGFGYGGAIWASYYTYQATGSMTAAAKAGGIVVATQWAFSWAGGFGNTPATQYSLGHFGAHALVGCASSMANGGECGSGALSAVAGLAGSAYGFEGSVIAGGIGSVIGGGKFADGAVTGAFGYLFNHCGSAAACWRKSLEQIGSFGGRVRNIFGGTATSQFALQGSGHALIVGLSYGESVSVDTNGQFCEAQTACMRLGPGAYMGAGGQVSAGYRTDTAPQLPGAMSISIGVGIDGGTGAAGFGAQGMLGLTDRSFTGAKGWFGYGAGLSLGVDVCAQRTRGCTGGNSP